MRGLTLLAGLALTLFDEGTAFVARRAGHAVLPTARPVRLSSAAAAPVTSGMGGATPQSYDGVRSAPGSAFASAHNRIVYIGMPLVPAVTELIIADCLPELRVGRQGESQAPASTPGAVCTEKGFCGRLRRRQAAIRWSTAAHSSVRALPIFPPVRDPI